MIGFRAEMTEMLPCCLGTGDFIFHLVAVEAVKTVPLDDARPNIFPVKNVLESDSYRGSSSPGRAGHSNDGVVFGHVSMRSGSGVRLRQPAGGTVHYTRTKPLEKQNISYCVISNILSYQTYGALDGRNPRCILRSDNSKYSNRLPGT